MGALRETEETNQPSDNADGDGGQGSDDEDGIASFPTLATNAASYSVAVACTGTGTVAGWIDFDLSGTFDGDERTEAACVGGNAALTWNGLSGLSAGSTYARFRIASNADDIDNPSGPAADGEVEDYTLTNVGSVVVHPVRGTLFLPEVNR